MALWASARPARERPPWPARSTLARAPDPLVVGLLVSRSARARLRLVPASEIVLLGVLRRHALAALARAEALPSAEHPGQDEEPTVPGPQGLGRSRTSTARADRPKRP